MEPMIIELNSLKFSDVIKRRPLGAFFIKIPVEYRPALLGG
jgi:hypothetical protein